MSNLLEKFEKKQIERLTLKKRIPAFRPGDTLKVTVRITEGSKSRLQAFEGVCIARKNNSVNSNFTMRKISHGEGVERVFPLFSPILETIDVIRKGDVRRAKLYYLRDLSGKKARIADRDRGDEVDQYAFIQEDTEKKDKLIENINKEEIQQAQESQKSDEKKVEDTKSTEEEKPSEKIKAKNDQKAENNSDEAK